MKNQERIKTAIYDAIWEGLQKQRCVVIGIDFDAIVNNAMSRIESINNPKRANQLDGMPKTAYCNTSTREVLSELAKPFGDKIINPKLGMCPGSFECGICKENILNEDMSPIYNICKECYGKYNVGADAYSNKEQSFSGTEPAPNYTGGVEGEFFSGQAINCKAGNGGVTVPNNSLMRFIKDNSWTIQVLVNVLIFIIMLLNILL